MISAQFPLQETCRQHGEAIAYADSHQEISYTELANAVEARTQALVADGLGKGDRVAWNPGHNLQTLVNFWSLFSIGAVACCLSPRFPPAKQTAIARRLDARWAGDEAAKSSRRPRTHYDPQAAATITLSSGSSGEPKAIVHSLEAHVASAVGASGNMPLGVGDRWLWSLPSYHVSGLAIVIRCAVAGATIYGMNDSDQLCVELLNAGKITHISLVATQLRRLLHEDSFPNPWLKAVLLGGSAVVPSLVRSAVERGVPVHTTYGLTEMASQVTTSQVNPVKPTSGRVLPYRELRIDDSGEILVRGETLCLGYAHGEKLESVADRDGWFHTGDIGKLDENGELIVRGRRDNMFVSGGENIYPETIERVLLEQPGVEEAIVVAKADEEFGFRPVAFVRAGIHRPSTWSEGLRRQLRSFEIPVAYLPFPPELQSDIKPSRAKLTEFVNAGTKNVPFPQQGIR